LQARKIHLQQRKNAGEKKVAVAVAVAAAVVVVDLVVDSILEILAMVLKNG
jgi:hypothetical protein